MKPMPRYLAPIAAVAMLAGGLAGCGVKESIQNADAEIGRFHAQLDAGQYDRIWAASAPEMRQATTQADFTKFLEAVHRKLGNVKTAKQVGWNANASTSGSTVTITMNTTFERGTGSEQFVYAKGADQHLSLAGYHIQSQDMMLN